MEIGAPGILAQAPERQHSVGVPDRVLEGPPRVFARGRGSTRAVCRTACWRGRRASSLYCTASM